VKNPIVTVTVKEITNSKVYIFGGGISSGVYDLNRRTTLLQLLCQIGNVAADDGKGGGSTAGKSAKVADFHKAYVMRGGKKIKEDFYKLFVNGETSDDMIIESGDAVFIPQALDKNVYVLGAVNAPRSIEYREGMRVMEAILESGGFTKYADQDDIVVRRKEGTDGKTLSVKAKKLFKEGDLTQNITLMPGDYILVRESFF
jgi:polysaccharide export outer membrane protein